MIDGVLGVLVAAASEMVESTQAKNSLPRPCVDVFWRPGEYERLHIVNISRIQIDPKKISPLLLNSI